MRTPTGIALALLLALPALRAARGDGTAVEPRRLDSYRVDGGFIDDPLAFSPDGTTLAFLVTDGATKAELRFVTPGGKAAPAVVRYPLAAPVATPEAMMFLDDARVLVVERDAMTRLARGQIFTRQGARRETLGPADGIALGTVAATPAIITYLRTQKGSAVTHVLSALRRDNLKPLAKRSYAEGKDGRVLIAGKPCKVLFFQRGFSELVVQRQGDFDKARDVRKPDVEAHIDAFSTTTRGERVLSDVMAWAELVQLRKKHPNEDAFVLYSDDWKQLRLVGSDDEVSGLATPLPLRKYDPQTLAYRPLSGDGGDLAVSLTIDPVNVDAVGAKKADHDWLHLFRLDLARRALVPLARLDGLRRPSSWRLAGSHLALLRKHKGFARGGMELEVWDLAPPAAAPAAAAIPPPAGR